MPSIMGPMYDPLYIDGHVERLNKEWRTLSNSTSKLVRQLEQTKNNTPNYTQRRNLKVRIEKEVLNAKQILMGSKTWLEKAEELNATRNEARQRKTREELAPIYRAMRSLEAIADKYLAQVAAATPDIETETAASDSTTASPSGTAAPDDASTQPDEDTAQAETGPTTSQEVSTETDMTSPSPELRNIQALATEYYSKIEPQLRKFVATKYFKSTLHVRAKEHKRLQGLVDKKVFEAGDAIQASGNDQETIQAIRKGLYASANVVLADMEKRMSK